MPFPVLPANGPSGYNLTKSLRFRSSASAYLNRTPASNGNSQRFTFSFWMKRGNIYATYCGLFGANTAAGGGDGILFYNDNLYFYANGATSAYFITNQLFRDPSAWYHFVIAIDSTQATASDRIKAYVNGSQITSFSVSLAIPLNYNFGFFNTNSYPQIIGIVYTGYFDGEMAEINFIDGQQNAVTDFGSFNATTGVWQPAKYTGTYGTNGYYLPFTNTTSTTTLGYDFSGNSNNWTTNNISLTAGSTYDSMTDVPTLTSSSIANYCVMNPLDKDTARGTVDNGNLRLTYTAYSSYNAAAIRSTIGVSSGKWYFEFRNQTWSGGGNAGCGNITSYTGTLTGINSFAGTLTPYIGVNADVFSNGIYFQFAGVSASLSNGTLLFATYASGDVVNFAFDLDAGKIWIGKNGTWYNSGDPAAGTNATSTFTTGSVNFYPEFEAVTSSTNVNQSSILPNFGQQGFAYTAPTGFNAINAYNLPTSTILAGNKYMDATLYTANGSTNVITNAGGFQPDFVWTKSRATGASWLQYDSVRGVNNFLSSNSTGAEGTAAGTLTSFNSNGFTLGANDNSNTSGYGNAVGYQWQAGQGTSSSNTSGSITSTVSVNPTAGFSVVTWTGTGALATVGHGLGVAPKLIINKQRNGSTYSWNSYHASLGNTYYIALNTTSAADNSVNLWNSTSPTSSVFTVNFQAAINPTGGTMVSYCWAEIAGFSKFGSYTGNGSADGPFIYCGFRPKFVMFKNASSANDWMIFDASRNTYNATNLYLQPNNATTEGSGIGNGIDLLSNGFKIRSTNPTVNGSTHTMIYAAFAENPFKNALAR